MAERPITPPWSEEAEQSVLGGIMLENRMMDEAADRLVPEMFYRRDHQIIFRAMIELFEADDPLDAVTVSQHLDKQGLLDDAGGMSYIALVARDTPTAANVKAYTEIVYERWLLREVIHAGADLQTKAYEQLPPSEILDYASQVLSSLGETSNRTGPMSVSEHMPAFIDALEARVEAGSSILGLPTGYEEIDRMTSGLQAGDLVIIAGRPSMGKTGLAQCISEHVAVHRRQTAVIFSMEMSRDQLMARLVASNAQVPLRGVMSGNLEQEQWTAMTACFRRLKDAPLYIDDTPALTTLQMRTRARRIKRKHGLSLIVVDYLQLTDCKGETRAQAIGSVSRALKSLAKELDVPVIALSQLNRTLEQRPDKRPRMSDLRESGDIEQDADVIMFVYRDEVYNEDSPDAGLAEIIFGKQRNGPTGVVRLTYRGPLTRFDNAAHEDMALARERAMEQSSRKFKGGFSR